MEKQPLSSSCAEQKPLRVVVVGLASCFGCQLQITCLLYTSDAADE